MVVDLEDALFHLDPEVKAWFTGFPGVLLVKLRAEADDILDVLKRFRVKDVLKVRPFLKVWDISRIKDICIPISEVIEAGSLGVRVYIRGYGLSKSFIEKLVFSCLEKLKVKINFASGKILVVDVIRDIVGISIVDRRNA
ncbi:MAG: hypothetical protein DRJ38_05275 [Thermoprotei archaeon]|nr:MAG: hypothetical protein DRJ38_05275 [Thermoprotei archaeon]